MEKRKRGTRSRGWVFRSKSIEGQESHREWQEQSCFHRLARRNSTIPDLARTMLVRRQYRAPFLIGSCVGALSFSSWYRMNEREIERERELDELTNRPGRFSRPGPFVFERIGRSPSPTIMHSNCISQRNLFLFPLRCPFNIIVRFFVLRFVQWCLLSEND